MSKATKPRGKIILKKNKSIDRIWHPESTLVFKSSKEKLVIGRYDGEELIHLDDEALNLCTTWKFKYDTSLVEEEDVTASEEGDEEGDEDEDEDEEGDEDGDEEEVVKDKPEKDEEDEEEEEEEVKDAQLEEEETENDIDENQEKEVDMSSGDLDAEFLAFTTNTKVFCDKVQGLFNALESKLSTSMKENEKLSATFEETRSTLRDTEKELEETKEKLSNIKKLIGGL